MIQIAYIKEWQQKAPWSQDQMVEQDLIISRTLIELFKHPIISNSLAFRGGTALYKLHILPPARYSEDIDLVQIRAEPIGNTISAIKEVLQPFLGRPAWKLNEGRATLFYKFQTETLPSITAKLKIEINTREHFSIYGLCEKEYGIESRWYSDSTKIKSYLLEELLGTIWQWRTCLDFFQSTYACLFSSPIRLRVAYSNHAGTSSAQFNFI